MSDDGRSQPPGGCLAHGRCLAKRLGNEYRLALSIPAGRPDLICGRFFGVCLFLLFLILLFILTIGRTEIGGPLGSLLAQRLLRL